MTSGVCIKDLFLKYMGKKNKVKQERTVEYVYGVNPLSKLEMANLVKYAFDRKGEVYEKQ